MVAFKHSQASSRWLAGRAHLARPMTTPFGRAVCKAGAFRGAGTLMANVGWSFSHFCFGSCGMLTDGDVHGYPLCLPVRQARETIPISSISFRTVDNLENVQRVVLRFHTTHVELIHRSKIQRAVLTPSPESMWYLDRAKKKAKVRAAQSGND